MLGQLLAAPGNTRHPKRLEPTRHNCHLGQRVHGELLICQQFREFSVSCYHAEMRDLAILFIHLITTLVRLASPGGVRSVVAESVLGRGRDSGCPLPPARIPTSGITA